jgi:hypothetical protein
MSDLRANRAERGEHARQELAMLFVRDQSPPKGRGGRRQRGVQSTALIVLGLTMACTVLAMFDLLQLVTNF